MPDRSSQQAPEGGSMRVPAPVRQAIKRIEHLSAADPAVRWVRQRVAPLATGTRGDLLSGRWLGHALHPVLTDLPIGCWTASAVLDLTGGRASRRASRRLVATGLVTAPFAAVTGLADWSSVRDQRAQRVGLVHGLGNVAAMTCYLQSWRRRRQGRHAGGVAWSLAGGGIAACTGYLGGHLAFNLGTGVGDRGLRSTVPSRPVARVDDEPPTVLATHDQDPVESWEGLD